MKDIDFDELDRAVSSHVNQGSSSSTSIPVKVFSPKPAEEAASSLGERRSSGRFMDVVHPSSDMRSTSDSSSSRSEDEAIQSAADNLGDAGSSTSDDNGPLESPFLADAKVEKRPLGAFSHEVHESGPAPSITNKAKISNNEEDNSGVQAIEAPLPTELNSDLLSLEADEASAVVPTEASETVPAVASQPVGPASITKQYSEQPSTGDQPAGNVFNTEAYKVPQVKTGKKKAGWLVVLWIFLLVVVGAGVDAAVSFFVLPLL